MHGHAVCASFERRFLLDRTHAHDGERSGLDGHGAYRAKHLRAMSCSNHKECRKQARKCKIGAMMMSEEMKSELRSEAKKGTEPLKEVSLLLVGMVLLGLIFAHANSKTKSCMDSVIGCGCASDFARFTVGVGVRVVGVVFSLMHIFPPLHPINVASNFTSHCF